MTPAKQYQGWSIRRRTRTNLWIAVIALVVSRPALAADLAPVNPPPAPSVWGTTTIGLEASPEFNALSSSSNAAGSYADTEAKLGVTHTFANNWFVGGLLQLTVKNNNTYQNYVEGSVGYIFDFDKFKLKPSAAIGDTGGATGLGASSTANAYYYALYLAGDLKLNSQWTWNIFEVRYRNAFEYTWITPKVTTGLTYEWSPGNFVYSNVGYAWKNTGGGLIGDKVNVAVGFRHRF
jgi:hypothetical protein